MEGWRNGLSMVWPRGRTEEGLGGGLEEELSRESGKASLNTTPCLRELLAVLAMDMALPGPGGMDLGVELCGDMGPKLRLVEGCVVGVAVVVVVVVVLLLLWLLLLLMMILLLLLL